MIERVVIDGKAGSACYLDDRFMPVDEARAVFLKVVFDDGGQVTLAVPKAPQQPPPPPIDPKKRLAWADARARAAVLLGRARREFDPDQPRDEDGKWTSGGGGGDGGGAKPSGGAAVAGYKPGIKTPKDGNDDHAKAVKQTWIDASPIKTIEDVKKLAGESQQALGDVGRSIAGKLGIEVKDPDSKVKTEKGVARTIAKAANPRYGSLAAVPDVARLTFLINHPAESDKILGELGKHFEVAGEPWKLTDVYYGDRAANVRLPNGMMGEVQMMEPSMAHAKSPDGGGGHDWYVISRETDPKVGIRPDPAAHAHANQMMRDIYGPVLDGLSADWKALLGKPGKSPKSAV